MENVNTLDIDGTQWEIIDSQARQDVNELKLANKIQLFGSVNLTLRPGYTAKVAKLGYCKKMGKLVVATLMIEDLRGEGLGTYAPIYFADLPYQPNGGFDFTATEVFKNTSFNFWGDGTKALRFYSTENFPVENCNLAGLIVFFEK